MNLIQMHVGSVGGLYHEFYAPTPHNLGLKTLPEKGERTLLFANDLFWSLHLAPERIFLLGEKIRDCGSLRQKHPSYEAIASDPALFVARVSEASKTVCDHAIGTQKFFSCLETLHILCSLYSDLTYFPHKLTVHEGFETFNLSSLHLLENALHPAENPYLSFIEENCLPFIKKQTPDIVWLNGRLSLYTIALAMLVKRVTPTAHVCVVGHASEYYSLNKITTYLRNNFPLFSIIDSINLDDSEQTRESLIRALSCGAKLESVPNLLYKEGAQDSFEIRQSETKLHSKADNLVRTASRRADGNAEEFGFAPSSVANIKIFPDHACSWNRCTFCGINKKYHPHLMENKNWDTRKAVDAMQELYTQGVRYVWMNDEAIPAVVLWDMAKDLLTRDLSLTWQARARFSEDFLTDGLCADLAKAGLKEIRFGLESGSPRVLAAMKKFPSGLTLATIDRIIEKFDAQGISVHCPMIIGYPSETDQERQDTYAFLAYLSNKYKGFTFNINIFGLDVNSPIFAAWYRHGISSVAFPCLPEHFIGNLVEWDSVATGFDRQSLDAEREDVMRRHLYPWLPPTAMTSTYLLYRLSETIRSTLTFKALAQSEPKMQKISGDGRGGMLSPSVVFSASRAFHRESYQLYNWENHECVYITPDLAAIFQQDTRTSRSESLQKELEKNDQGSVLKKGLAHLQSLGFLELPENGSQAMDS